MNMVLVVGLNGLPLINNKIGIIFSEFKFKLHQLTNSWEIELYQLGLVNQMEDLFIYLHTLSQILKEMEMQIFLRISLIKIDTINGSLFTLDIQDHNKKLRLILDGQIQKITKSMKMLNISLFPNIIFLLEKINISQDSVETLLWLHLTLEKVLSDQEMISKLRMMLLISLLDKNNY
mgnify:CR=1 FL=1